MHDHDDPLHLTWTDWILNGLQRGPEEKVGPFFEKNWGGDCTHCSGMACGQTVERAFVEKAYL